MIASGQYASLADMIKPISNPDFISVLVLTRGRPASFKEMLASLAHHASRRDLMDLWVYIDEDDPTAPELLNGNLSDKAGFPIHFHVRPRPDSLCGAATELWEVSTSNAGIYLGCADDYLMATPGWDDRIREKFSCYPDRIVLGQITDPSLPDRLLYMALSAEWINLLGYIVPPVFPTWYGDTWLEEIGDFVQRRIVLGVEMIRNGGKSKTQRLRDVAFWYDFFRRTQILRLEAAESLRRCMYPPGSPEYEASREQANRQAQELAASGYSCTEEYLAHLEETFSDDLNTLPSRSYVKTKLDAVLTLYQLEMRNAAMEP